MSFSKIMAFISVLTRDSAVASAAEGALGTGCAVARSGGWGRLLGLVHERPTTGVVVDSDVLGDGVEGALVELTARFPSVWLVLVARPGIDPLALLRLGKRGIQGLVLTNLDDVGSGVVDAVRRGARTSTESLVTRAVSPYLPARETRVVRLALRGAQLGWSADDLAAQFGRTRAHLSVRLRGLGLPSVGHLLVWAKLLHAGRWLGDAGRSGESVSRQLDYSNGAAFRRALRNYVGATPTQLREAGGLAPVLGAFAAASGLNQEAVRDRSAA
jgi:AraC-like DNA-binding protein